MGKYTKAITAVLTNVVTLSILLGLPLNIPPEAIVGIATVVNGVLVWLFPNK